ncbi:hypothetical protein D3C78_589110 [compost metagenome]
MRASDHLTVGASQHVKLGSGLFVEAGDEIHYHAGSKVVIDAGMELTAKGGGSWLKLDPSGVTLSGTTIKLNSGGSPGEGLGLTIIAPALPNAADQEKAGDVLTTAIGQQKLRPPQGICLECWKKALRENQLLQMGAMS